MSDVVLFPPDAPRQTRTCVAATMPGKAVAPNAAQQWVAAPNASDFPLAIMGPDNHFGKGIDTAIKAGSRGEAGFLQDGEVGHVFVLKNAAMSDGDALCHAASGNLDDGTAGDTIVAVLDEDHVANAAAQLRRVRGASGAK